MKHPYFFKNPAIVLLFSVGLILFLSCNRTPQSNSAATDEEMSTAADSLLHPDTFRAEARRILDFWAETSVDSLHGGFAGRIDAEGNPEPQADKGVILHTRLLWSFSAGARELGNATYRPLADRAFEYVTEYFIDPEYGGVFWMLDAQGQPTETRKQIYAQAFAIYALAEYNRLTGEQKALDEAVAIFRLLEEHSHDPQAGGYFDSFDRQWQRMDETYLGGQENPPAKTMNTHLHVLEAFTNLYRVWKDPLLGERLRELIDLHLGPIMNEENGHLELFFAPDWSVLGEEISYGHDIEAAWLLTEAAEVLGDESVLEEVKPIAVRIADITLKEGLDDDGGLLYEASPEGLTNTDKHWWPQAEAMTGFYNAYQLSGDSRFYEAARRNWNFTRRHLIDREHGDWRRFAKRDGTVPPGQTFGGPWKTPYHNTRSCLEMMRRVQ
jgi:mannobiose 2-epimerase